MSGRFKVFAQVGRVGVALFWLAMVLASGYLLLTAVDIAGKLFNDEHVADGERLNFLGAVLGSALGAILAIGGVLFVDAARRGREEKATRAVMRETLSELQISLEQAAKPLEIAQPIDEQKMPIIHALERLETAFDLLGILRKEMKITDVQLWRKLRMIETDLAEKKAMLDSERKILERRRVTAAVLDVAHDKVSTAASVLIPLVKIAIEDLRK